MTEETVIDIASLQKENEELKQQIQNLQSALQNETIEKQAIDQLYLESLQKQIFLKKQIIEMTNEFRKLSQQQP